MHDSLGIHYCLDILNYLNEHNYLRGPDNYIRFYCDLRDKDEMRKQYNWYERA